MKRAFRIVPVLAVVAVACAPAGAGPPDTDVARTTDETASLADDSIAGGRVSTPAPAAGSGAGVPSKPRTVAGLPDLGLTAVRADGSLVRVFSAAANAQELASDSQRLSLDEQTTVRAAPFGRSSTLVRWRDVFTGADLASVDVAAPDLEPAATSSDGSLVALVNRDSPAEPGAIAGGRRQTTIVVANQKRGERARFELKGNVLPEAFSSVTENGLPVSLFVLEYHPARSPTHYRVRVLDLLTGKLGLPVNLRSYRQPVDASMAGVSRTQVIASHGDGVLFTLYRGVAGEDGRHGYAFVHTLGLFGGVWCLDIAPEMELDRTEGSLVVAGDHLVVASANGTVGNYDIDAILDPAGDPSMRNVESYLSGAGDTPPTIAAAGDRVWVAFGNLVYQLDAATLEMIGRAPYVSDEPVTAIAATADGVLLAHPGGRITTPSGAEIQLPDGPPYTSAEIVRLLVR